MAYNIKEILKFLFPEWQIIAAIKQQGFIAKPDKSNVEGSSHRTVLGAGGTSTISKPTSNSLPQPKNIFKKTTVIQSGNTAQQSKVGVQGEVNDITAKMDAIRAELAQLLVGQTNYLDRLCRAFKRPFVTGFNGVNPKNIMVILGNKGTGKHSSVFLMAELMKQKQLAKYPTVSTIDLSLYPTASEFDLFLADLYQGLYGQSDMVVFDNFDLCHASIINVITSLSLTGKYTLGSRYVLDNNNLVPATGLLLQNSISEISANGKYFIFISEKTEQHVLDVFGSKFVDAVGDIIHTEAFTGGQLQQLALKVLEGIKAKCHGNLAMALNYDQRVIELLAEQYKENSGINGMVDFAHRQIYRPLAEYRLTNNVNSNQTVLLSVADGQLTAQIAGQRISLSDLIPKKYHAGIDNVKKELSNIVGLEPVKQYVLSLEDNLKIQQRRKDAGHRTANVSMHMVFTGNPGTGKTTIARIVARYLKALGVLSTGQLREVTRADLVGQYVGHTAKLTNDVIKSALGGVLFIDEAYALCRDKHDIFGLEAIDSLVKGMEDHRDDLVVILAGYQQEMAEFFKSNPGLKSRFPNVIEFPDYTAEEMYRIAEITAKTKGYRISADCRTALMELFDKKQIKGRNDSGNGRLVRNVIERAILNQSQRLVNEPQAELDLLSYPDFKFAEKDSFDLEASLAQIIGLDNVKEFVRTQYKLLIAQQKRQRAGIEVDITQSLNMIFSGNPGTGKTTVARLMANMFKEMGLLKSGHLVETDRAGLVAEYVGQTAKKTEEVFRSALGGVLFIDEAYALAGDGGSFGQEAIDTLVKLIEDHRGELVVILAGYHQEMKEFLKTNSGLQSRFPLQIEFPDYTAEELYQIALKMLAAKGFRLAAGADQLLKEQMELLHKGADAQAGNGRMVRNYLEEVLRQQSARIATSDVAVEEMNVIIPDDLTARSRVSPSFDLESELAKIVGLDQVKDYIRSLHARLRIQRERKKLGLPVDDTQTLHMIFKGNPGTGKTMVARTVARLLYNIGVIKSTKLIETDRSGLVAGYLGQTAIKTREKLMEALDGVLFIDEAYSLSQGGPNDFGKEAIDTLVKLMDDYRDRLVVILAGYSGDMDRFLALNPGLKSRFPNVIEFADYSTDQLVRIAQLFFGGKGYELTPGALRKLQEIFAVARLEPQFGNGRYVRNLFERAVNNQAMRLSTDTDLTKEELITIIEDDIERV